MRASPSRSLIAALALALVRMTSLAQTAPDDLDQTQNEALATQADPPQPDQPLHERELPNPFQDPRDRIYYPGDTESFKPLTSKLVGNILLDQKEIWTSPFRMHRGDSKWWIGAGAVTAALIATDHSSSKLLENSPSQITWGNRFSQTGAAYTLVPVVAGFYGIGVAVNNAQARETGVLGTEALVDSLIVVSVLKPIAGRVRPDATSGKPGQFFAGSDSFPSGHSIESWALASVVAHEYKRNGGRFVPYVAYGLASVVSAARFAAQKHYASDIVAGGVMGWFIGRYVYQTHEDHAAHHHAFQPKVIPSVDPATRSYSVSLYFSPSPQR
jgi:membrane-associated phospholipid phosphatase